MFEGNLGTIPTSFPWNIGVLMGAFHSTKNSDLKIRKFHVANGTVNREIFRMVIQARVDRAVPFSFGQKFPEIYDREVLQTEIFSNGTVISDQNGPTEKVVHLERWTFFFENFPVGQNRSIQFWTRISGNFG